MRLLGGKDGLGVDERGWTAGWAEGWIARALAVATNSQPISAYNAGRRGQNCRAISWLCQLGMNGRHRPHVALAEIWRESRNAKTETAKVAGMFPHFFGFDFSAALPWAVGGFLLGVLLTALWRGLGLGRARSAELQTALFDLRAMRSVRDEREELTTRLQSDFAFIEIALADAERRAAVIDDMKRVNADLDKAEAESRAGWLAAATELATLKNALQTQVSRSTTLEQRLHFISAENTAASAASETRARELETLRADLAASGTLTRELEKLRADLAAAAMALQDVPKLKSEYNAAASQIETLRAELDKRGKQSAVSQYDFDTAIKDLVATRNLTIKQAEVNKALRTAYEKLEAKLGAGASSTGRALGFAGRTQGLKARARHAFLKGSGTGGASKRPSAKSKAGSHGAVSGRSLPAGTPGTFFLSKTKKWRGSAIQNASGRVWAATGRGAHVNGADHGASHGNGTGGGTDAAQLKARIASLSDELENYRRLRDAVVAANRIAQGDV